MVDPLRGDDARVPRSSVDREERDAMLVLPHERPGISSVDDAVNRLCMILRSLDADGTGAVDGADAKGDGSKLDPATVAGGDGLRPSPPLRSRVRARRCAAESGAGETRSGTLQHSTAERDE